MRNVQVSVTKCKEKKNEFVASRHFRFDTVAASNLAELAQITTEFAWSPCRWQDGRRSSGNYTGCDCAVWDFDDGLPTMKDMAARCRDLGFAWFIATSRNHLIPKAGHRLGDRYRLVMPASEPFANDGEIFAAQMREVLKVFGRTPDPACKDAARFYFRSMVVVDGADTGKYFTPPAATAAVEVVKKRDQYISSRANRVRSGKLSRRCVDFLDHGKTWNGRAIAAFAVAAELAALAMDESQIINMIMASPFPRTGPRAKDNITDREIIRNVRNGIKTSRDKTKV